MGRTEASLSVEFAIGASVGTEKYRESCAMPGVKGSTRVWEADSEGPMEIKDAPQGIVVTVWASRSSVSFPNSAFCAFRLHTRWVVSKTTLRDTVLAFFVT